MEGLKDFENADTISIDTLALEEMVLEERAKEIDVLETLGKKVSCLHTNLLYYRQPKTKMGIICYDIWKIIIKKVGGVHRSWRNLGEHLSIPPEDLDYIGNMKDDPTDIVLKVFMQSEDATLDKVIDAFIKMKRYDILKTIEQPLTNLALFFIKEDNKFDSGYDSNTKSSEKKEIVSLSYTQNDLPPVLQSKNASEINEKMPKKPKQPTKLPEKRVEKKSKTDSTTLLLTFAEDGQETASNLQNKINNWPDDWPAVSIITLNEHKEDVLQNPERCIRDYFEKADFVVPVLTSGYFNAIKCHNLNLPNMSQNLDYKYVHFIYTLIVNNYIHLTGCLNKKVRSVIPVYVDPNVMANVTLYPDLMPFTNEECFDETFIEFIKKLYT